MSSSSRRHFLRTTGAGLAAGLLPSNGLLLDGRPAQAQEAGARPPKPPAGVSVINPRGRVPVSLIIDDSTCLVNLAHFAIPQFHEVFPNEYHQPWKTLPREVPDSFVRKFGEWCAGRGIKGKFSLIPYPACVGWLDRDLPGWSKQELDASLELVRGLMTPSWDIHPEMVSHTWVIDPKTGRPFPQPHVRLHGELGLERQERPACGIHGSLVEVLKNTLGLRCDGITTPGGFGDRALPAVSPGCWKPAATSSGPRSRTTFAICSRTTRVSLRASSWPRAWTGGTRDAWSR